MDDNEDWGLDDFDTPDQPTGDATPPQQNGQPQGSPEVNPVKLSRGKTGLLLVGLLIIVAIILITIKGCSVEKKANKPQNQGTVNSVVSPNVSGGENAGISSDNNTEFSAVSPPAVSTPVDNSNVPNNPQGNAGNGQNQQIWDTSNTNPNPPNGNTSVATPPDGNVPNVSDDILQEVGTPQLSTEIETNGIVIGKHVYYYKGSYIYGVHVSILFGDATKSVYYFCPKKTFDALRSADAIKVTYSFDSAGNVSITSITK